MSNNNNPILTDQFLFSTGTKKSRKVTVSFEKVERKLRVQPDENEQYEDSYCIRIEDSKKPLSVKAVALTKDTFCGVEHGIRERTHRAIVCWPQRSYNVPFLIIYLARDHVEGQGHRGSCLVFYRKGSEEIVKTWKNVIAEHLGLKNCWSVTIETAFEGPEERVMLCLMEKGLALNSTCNTRETPSVLWFHSFTDYNVTTSYSLESKDLTINCTRKEGTDTGHLELREGEHIYMLKTSYGVEISLRIQTIQNGLLIASDHIVPATEEDEADEQPIDLLRLPPPPCCASTPIFTQFTASNPFVLPEKTAISSADPEPPPCQYGHTQLPIDEIKDEDNNTPTVFRHTKLPLCNPSNRPVNQSLTNFIRSEKRTLRRSWSIGLNDSRKKCNYKGQPKTISSDAFARKTYRQHKQWYKSFISEISCPAKIQATSERESVYDRQDLPSPTFERRKPPSLIRSKDSILGRSKKVSISDDMDKEDYWTSEICFSLQNILENQYPDPDTLKLNWKQKSRLIFYLLPSPGPMLAGGWQDLAGRLCLTSMEMSIIEHFSLTNQNTPVEVLLHHWQFVYNKQVKMKKKDPDFQYSTVLPPCTQEQLVTFLTEMERLDVLEICAFSCAKTPS